MRSAAHVRTEIQTFTSDRRTIEQIQRDATLRQEAQDLRLEQLWHERVADNVRRRLAAKVIQLEEYR
jgi:hypothetical protein